MGRYISVDLYFEPQQPLALLLQSIFSSSFFRPIGVVGSNGNNLLLAGYALEVGGYFSKKPVVETLSSPQDVNHEYLQQKKADLINEKVSDDADSPFEVIDPVLSVSFVESILAPEVVQQLDAWNTRFPMSRLNIYGTISIHAQQGNPLNSAYRPRNLSETLSDEPFLKVWVSRNPKAPHPYAVTLYSTSAIWLHDSLFEIGNLKIEPPQADKNLANLVNFTKHIVESNRSHLSDVAFINLERGFIKEGGRIFPAFHEGGVPLVSLKAKS
jgi:hypothetical protein